MFQIDEPLEYQGDEVDEAGPDVSDDVSPESDASAEPTALDGSAEDVEEEDGFGWYAVQTYSGYEKSVRKTLNYLREKRAIMIEGVKEIYLPTEIVRTRRKDGREMKRECPLFPGYVFIRMRPNPELVTQLTEAPKVIGFIRTGNELQRFTNEEMRAIEESKEERSRPGSSDMPYSIGSRVKIVEGLFAPFSGAVEDVSPEKKRLKVTVGIFGRPIPVELSFDQVELASDEDE
ncbi:transcription termination/antitermination factor NusG [bacterium]|nr:transcription termination/antitermination factor NusG [bacterium]